MKGSQKMSAEKLEALFSGVLSRRILKKAVFSKAESKDVVKETATLAKKSDGSLILAVEKFTKDNKTYRRNFDLSGEALGDTAALLASMASEEYRQVNIITTAGEAEIKRSKSGSIHISDKIAKDAVEADIEREGKKYILDGEKDIAFLRELGITDKNGRIHDKKQAKFRQINRFLEILRDVEDKLPTDRPPVIYDLCCGKSYLTFAVYYYFTSILGRDAEIVGVDLKSDVVAYCADVAKRLGFKNLRFVSGNINEYRPEKAPDMVISLHACDIATDIVLANAVKWGTTVILSTPCCHHEMSKQLSSPADAPMRDALSFILSQPILKQKLCDVMTDGLRAKRLEAEGYNVTALELIDPDETPKNVMLRAVKSSKKSAEAKERAYDEYKEMCAALGVAPFLEKLLNGNEK